MIMEDDLKRVAAIDIDGVLANFEDFLVEFMKSIYPEVGGKNRHLYSLRQRYKGVRGAAETAIAFSQDPNAYYGLHPIEGGFMFLKEVLDHGFDVVLVTARPTFPGYKKSARFTTQSWLRRNLVNFGIDFDDLLGVKFVSNKAAWLHNKDIALFVDDNPEEIHDAKKLGIPAYSWAQPWNEHMYPKLFRTRDGYTMVQDNDSTTARYFWE